MKVLLYYSFLISVTLAAHIALETSQLDGRIIGGDIASIVDYPYQVSVQLLPENHLCGGAIIARTWILTTAHCVHGLSVGRLSVRVGTEYRGQGGDVITVVKIVSHANYSTLDFDYDIALLQLEEPISLSELAEIISLPDDGTPIVEGTLANVTGWGATQEGGAVATTLKAVQVPVMSRSVCRYLYRLYTISERMFCAGLFEGGKDSCDGDVGGPLVINSVLYGLVSWGLGCGRPRYPGVYTNVGALRDWITEQTGI